jgi:hypothetical protein
MNPNGPPDSPIDVPLFDKNRRKFPPDQLVPYWGKQVAWNADGTRIVASGDTGEEVDRQLDALGIPYSHVVYDFIYDPNVSYF